MSKELRIGAASSISSNLVFSTAPTLRDYSNQGGGGVAVGPYDLGLSMETTTDPGTINARENPFQFPARPQWSVAPGLRMPDPRTLRRRDFFPNIGGLYFIGPEKRTKTAIDYWDD